MAGILKTIIKSKFLKIQIKLNHSLTVVLEKPDLVFN